MTQQIAVRLPEELVEFVDGLVADGTEKSRAAVVAKALAREKRRRAEDRDIAILMREGDDEDLQAFIRHTAHRPIDID